MFRFISKRIPTFNISINDCINPNNIHNKAILNLNKINYINKEFHTINKEIKNIHESDLNKSQRYNFSYGKFNLYRFNKEINSRYSLKDYTKSITAKEWLQKKKDSFKSNLKIDKLSSTLEKDRDTRKLQLNPIFSPNKKRFNKVLRKNIIKNINISESQDHESLENRLFLKDMNSQTLENLRKIKENKIFNKKLHELHERKLAVKLESKKLENLIENFDFKYKNFEVFNDTEANSVRTYNLSDFSPVGRLNYLTNLDEKNPLKNKKYEAPYKIQTRFNEFLENKNHLQNLRIESLLTTKKSNPALNKYLYLEEEKKTNLFEIDTINKEINMENLMQIELSNNLENINNKKGNKELDANCNNINIENSIKSDTKNIKKSNFNLKEINLNSNDVKMVNEINCDIIINTNINSKTNVNSDPRDLNNFQKYSSNYNKEIILSENLPEGNREKKNESNDISFENYFKKHIDLKSKINNYETELYNEFRNMDVYNKYQKGIVKFSELSLEENLNYIKFNLKNSDDLFKMYIELSNSQNNNSLIFGSMIQKLSANLKSEKDVNKTLNLYEYKDLLRDFKKNFKIIDNKNFVDTIFAIGKLHKKSREFSPKFFQHLLKELFEEASERTETFKLEEIAFLCQGLILLDITDKTDDLLVISKKNNLLYKIFDHLIYCQLSNNKFNLTEGSQNLINNLNDDNYLSFQENSPIAKLRFLHHASSILRCFNYKSILTNKDYIDLVNYFSIPIRRIIAERAFELIDEVDVRDFKHLISCYGDAISKLRIFIENPIEENLIALSKEEIQKIDLQGQELIENTDIYRNNYNRSNLIKRLDRNFETFLNEKEFLIKEELEQQSRGFFKLDKIMNPTKYDKDKKNDANDKIKKEEELINKEFNENDEKINFTDSIEKSIQIIKSAKNENLLENPKKNFLQIMDFLTTATLTKVKRLEIKETSDMIFSVSNAKLFDYKIFFNKIRKQTLDELDKGKQFNLRHITKYFWGLSQMETKFFVPYFNLDFNSIIFPRTTKKNKSGSFVEINKIKKVIFEMKNVVDNRDLSIFLYSLANMGYSDSEFFIPILHNLVQYDKMNYLNSFNTEKNKGKNFNGFKFNIKDIGYYLNALSFLNFNDEILLKFFLTKLQGLFGNDPNLNNNILGVNHNNDIAISMIFTSLVHLNAKLLLRNLKNWQQMINSMIKYCNDNYTEKNSKNLISVLWFMTYSDYQIEENLFNKFMNLISNNFKSLSKFDKVVLNQILILLFLRNRITFNSEDFGVEQIKELNQFSYEFEKTRKIIQNKYAETHYENKSNSHLVKDIFEKYSNILLNKGLTIQKDYIIENSFISDIYIKQKKILIEVYDHYEILKDKNLTGYNLLREQIFEELGYKTIKIYTNDFDFLIAKEDEEKLFEYLLEKINFN